MKILNQKNCREQYGNHAGRAVSQKARVAGLT